MLLSHCAKTKIAKKAIVKYKIWKNSKGLLDRNTVNRVENGEIDKKSLVKTLAEKHPKIIHRYSKRIDLLLKNAPDCCNFTEIQKQNLKYDIYFCRFAYGFIPEEYICFHLMDKNPKERRTYISESDHMRYVYLMNDPVDIMTFNDKMQTYERFSKYYHRDIIAIKCKKDYQAFNDYIKKHPVFVKKQVFESCGNSIERIDINTCGKTKKELFNEFLSQNKVIIEELVDQGEVTAVFNSSSVNTIRCITFNTKDGVIVPYCFMKIGRAGSFVDNGGAGGILVGIDEKTGITNTNGVDENRNVYDVHPDSGTRFKGHKLPDWDNLISICKELSEKIPSVPYIGWDFAYTEKNGWVIIEGNGMSQFIGPQTIWQCGIKAEVQRYMKKINR